MIIVSKLHYDIVSIKWLTTDNNCTIETEKEKIINELGEPYTEKELNHITGIEMVYDSYRSIIITENND